MDVTSVLTKAQLIRANAEILTLRQEVEKLTILSKIQKPAVDFLDQLIDQIDDGHCNPGKIHATATRIKESIEDYI